MNTFIWETCTHTRKTIFIIGYLGSLHRYRCKFVFLWQSSSFWYNLLRNWPTCLKRGFLCLLWFFLKGIYILSITCLWIKGFSCKDVCELLSSFRMSWIEKWTTPSIFWPINYPKGSMSCDVEVIMHFILLTEVFLPLVRRIHEEIEMDWEKNEIDI